MYKKMFKVELPIYVHSDKSLKKESIDGNLDFKSMHVVSITYYSINYVEPDIDMATGEKTGVTIVSSGDHEMFSPLSKEEIEDIIDKNSMDMNKFL